MCELNVNDLKFVAGGSSRESQLSVNVVLDEPYHEDYTVRVYLDGELQRDKTHWIAPSSISPSDSAVPAGMI